MRGVVPVDGFRMLAFAGSIAAALIGSLYAAAADVDRPVEARRAAHAATPAVAPILASAPIPAPAPAPPPEGRDVPEDVLAMIEGERDGIIVSETGVRVGPLTILPRSEAPEPPTARPSRRRATRAPASVPRLHPDPGRHVLATARRMMARGEAVQGSCYRYLSEVFTRAGHAGWRNRRVVHRGPRNGPYADLDQIRPGDWLYIVNHPERTPVGTHSVLFVSWIDRARGYAQVIEHSGLGAASAGQERPYDVRRTYYIVRPTLAR